MLAWKGFNTPDRVKTVALTQPRLSIELREFEPSDYRRLAEIYDAIFPERSRSIDEWRFYDDSLDKSKYYFKRYVCLGVGNGKILGFGELWNPPWMFNRKSSGSTDGSILSIKVEVWAEQSMRPLS